MYYIVTISTWTKKVNIKSRHETREEAEEARKAREKKCFGMAADTIYEILGPEQMVKVMEDEKAASDARRKLGAKRAAEKRAKNKEKGKKPNFILCPTCGAKSKKLYSEMGGMQTRKCRNGHLFEVDTFFGFETTKRRIQDASRSVCDGIDPSYMSRRYGSDYRR